MLTPVAHSLNMDRSVASCIWFQNLNASFRNTIQKKNLLFWKSQLHVLICQMKFAACLNICIFRKTFHGLRGDRQCSPALFISKGGERNADKAAHQVEASRRALQAHAPGLLLKALASFIWWGQGRGGEEIELLYILYIIYILVLYINNGWLRRKNIRWGHPMYV